jgi:plastocyanin
LLLLAAELHGAEATKSGIIKGTITVAGKPTSEAVISLEGISAETLKGQISAAKPKKAIMDQKEMKFLPRVLPVMVGSTVEFPNHDTAWHNVYSKGGAKDFDLGLYPPGKTRSVTLDKPGVVRILCNAHPNMEAFIVVKEHPLFLQRRQRWQLSTGWSAARQVSHSSLASGARDHGVGSRTGSGRRSLRR